MAKALGRRRLKKIAGGRCMLGLIGGLRKANKRTNRNMHKMEAGSPLECKYCNAGSMVDGIRSQCAELDVSKL